jgi:hypothetical protein
MRSGTKAIRQTIILYGRRWQEMVPRRKIENSMQSSVDGFQTNLHSENDRRPAQKTIAVTLCCGCNWCAMCSTIEGPIWFYLVVQEALDYWNRGEFNCVKPGLGLSV